MRGSQKCITLGSRTSRSAHEVAGGWVGWGGWVGGLFNYSVSPVQSGVGVGVWSLELDWTSTGLPLDNNKKMGCQTSRGS